MTVKDSGFGSMTSDGDSRPDVHPESPVIDKLADDNNVNPDASVDSPTSIKTDSTTIEALIDDITGFLDGIAASCAIINGAPEADRMADDSNSHIEVEKDYWDAESGGVSFEVESECDSSESDNMNQRTWTEPGLRKHI
ncbi:hypothetical protein MRS44_000926 [Fusarium solani]|uniref:uncharacterized protein n=1 Tax=Fusarium solani TaxID=169388 RepID=UPI0032C479BF|nr:hypothetical protein MRS44_000926 [Fusarium solani]